MCTVTFLPIPENDGFILTSNRDEQAIREKAAPPQKHKIGQQQVVFPKDLKAGGTWIASSSRGFTLCLLNGGLEPHVRNEPYRQSRGLVVLDFFTFNSVKNFVAGYNFNNIEPFTLIFVESTDQVVVHELFWDGTTPSLNTINPAKAKIWSSVTLYETKVIEERKRWFKQWLSKHPVPAQEAVIDFHKTGGTGDTRNDLLMNRDNRLHTVSITSVVKSNDQFKMKYHDLYDNSQYHIFIK